MSYEAKLIAGIILALLLVGAGWACRGWFDNSTELFLEKKIEKTRQLAAKTAADQIAKIPSLTTKIYTGTAKDKRYVDCVQTDEVWNSIQEAYK